MADKVLVLHGGELASDIAERIVKESVAHSVTMQLASMENFKEFKLDSSETVQTVVFVVQTIENEAAPEAAGSCCRFFKRKTHAADLLAGKLRFAVLALGDSNLLLDRQTTTAKDCNQAAKALNARLKELGATPFYTYGNADDRTGNQEVQPWIAGLSKALVCE